MESKILDKFTLIIEWGVIISTTIIAITNNDIYYYYIPIFVMLCMIWRLKYIKLKGE